MKTNYETETLKEVLKETEPYVFKNPISKYTPNEHLGNVPPSP